MKKHNFFRSALAGLFLSAASSVSAALVLDIAPDTEGNWVFVLTGTGDGTGVDYINGLGNFTGWNSSQGFAGDNVTVDSVESWNLFGLVNSNVADAIDINDGAVEAEGLLAGIAALTDARFILKFYDAFGETMSDFNGRVFNERLTLKPQDKESFSDVWNEGTYVQNGLTVNVSASPVPEPASYGVLAGGIVLLLAAGRRRARR